nr:outer membrane beta-barrel protein [Leeuwenhoekiella parthenopeia]
MLRLANQEEAIADTDEESENSKSARWGIAPIVAPVYYGDFGGSGIDPQFADNAKRGDINLSYGVQVSYALNDKFKLRAGINRVDLGYRTEQVAFSPSIQANALRSVDYNKSASQVQVSTFNNREDVSNSIPNAPVSEEFAASNFASPSSTLRQQLGYIEVPLEAEYALIDKKIGMQIIGGFSTLFLNDDSVILEEGSRFSTELGSSNSLNNTSFSTNIGLGFDYRITPTLEFNLEPMFKYQLNAYTNGVSDFKPYYMGIYTGINLKF